MAQTLQLDLLVVRELPVEYEVRDGVLELRLSPYRPVAVDALKDALLEALRDPRVPRPALLLLDARGANENPVGNEMLRRAYMLASLVPRIAPRCAVLVSRAFPEALANVIFAQAERQRLEIRVFRDSTAARGWLRRCQ